MRKDTNGKRTPIVFGVALGVQFVRENGKKAQIIFEKSVFICVHSWLNFRDENPFIHAVAKRRPEISQ